MTSRVAPKKLVYILGALGLFLYTAGLFFKIQHWPLATISLSSGLALIYFVVFPWYTRLKWKDDSHVSAAFIYMVVGSLLIVVPSLLVSLNVQRETSTEAGSWSVVSSRR
ncbi:MAG: hypothetical protein MZV63_60720 [Marinilabiliales bacterium]|nr:hypothetical protein [Marinilabiliales bacterium]